MKRNDLCNEIKELQIIIEVCHNHTNELKRRIDNLQSKFITSHDANLSDRIMKSEDYTMKKRSPYKWYCRACL